MDSVGLMQGEGGSYLQVSVKGESQSDQAGLPAVKVDHLETKLLVGNM